MSNTFNIDNLKPFSPKKLPLQEEFNDKEILKLISQSSISLGKYSGFLSSIINPMLLISPLLTQEAVLSSKLEGTHATFDDLLHFEAGNKIEIEKDEIHEIFNYRSALLYALDNIGTIGSTDKLPLTGRIIKEMHKILLNNVRGSTKRRGEFKVFQNYIGSRGSISFVPVSPDETPEYITNLEEFIHYEDISPVIQAAILHTQFEMIHPFEDGNGRIGRLLIPLFFYYRKIIPTPTFYMSEYFESDRRLYLQNLSNISANGDWNSWIKYFLQGLIQQAEENTRKAQEINNLYNSLKHELSGILNTPKTNEFLDFLFSKPIFSSEQINEAVSLSKRTIYLKLNALENHHILYTDNSTKNKTYFFNRLLGIIR